VRCEIFARGFAPCRLACCFGRDPARDRRAPGSDRAIARWSVLAIGAPQEIHVMQIRTLALAALLLAASESAAQDQRRSFYDRNGSFAGSSTTYNNGRNSSFYDRDGSFAGSAIQHGNSTSFYDMNGHFTGSVINTSPRR